jgi:BrnA antitoxin of type II toxin-antitoxin system
MAPAIPSVRTPFNVPNLNRFGFASSSGTSFASTLRLDPDIVAHFKKRGPGWQSRINATLRRTLKPPKPAKKG